MYTHDQVFERIDFTIEHPAGGEYEKCAFKECNFYECDLSDFRFTDCAFSACNLSLAKLGKTALRDVVFRDCKMLGLRFDQCNGFGLSFTFDHCVLNHSSFYRTKIKKTSFRHCQLQETDFTECDLSGSVMDQCDLTRATFDNSILEKVDLRTSHEYSIDPEKNKIKKAKFTLPGVLGLLDKYDIDLHE